jgi:hypothetical protein
LGIQLELVDENETLLHKHVNRLDEVHLSIQVPDSSANIVHIFATIEEY